MKPLWWMRGPLRDPEPGAGGGDGGGDKFDPVKFKTELMDDFKKLLKAQPTPKADPPKADPPEPEPKADPNDKTDPKVKALEKKLADMAKKYDEESAARKESDKKAEEKERTSILRTELGKLGIPAERIDSALRIFGPDVKRAEDGSLVGSDDTPLSDFLGASIKNHEYLLPAKQVGGAGASAGRSGRGVPALQLEDIKVGMKPEDIARASAQISAVLAGRQ